MTPAEIEAMIKHARNDDSFAARDVLRLATECRRLAAVERNTQAAWDAAVTDAVQLRQQLAESQRQVKDVTQIRDKYEDRYFAAVAQVAEARESVKSLQAYTQMADGEIDRLTRDLDEARMGSSALSVAPDIDPAAQATVDRLLAEGRGKVGVR